MGPATPVCQELRGIPECRAVGVRAGNVSAEPGGRATLAREQPVQACLLDTVGSVGGDPGEKSGDAHWAMVGIYTFR